MGRFARKIKRETNDISMRIMSHTHKQEMYGIKYIVRSEIKGLHPDEVLKCKKRLLNAHGYSCEFKPYDIIEGDQELADLCNYLINNNSFMNDVYESIPITKIPLKDISYIAKDGGYYRLFTSNCITERSNSKYDIDRSGLLYVELHFGSDDLVLIAEINLLDIDKGLNMSPLIIASGREVEDKRFDQDRFDIVVMDILQIWTMIQVLHLNPICKEVLYTKNIEPAKESRKSKHYKRSNKIKYIRKIYVNKPVIQSLMSKRNYNITCDCWYVIGHWRTYKSGKRVWIEGYWKGRNRAKELPNGTRIRDLPKKEVLQKYS